MPTLLRPAALILALAVSGGVAAQAPSPDAVLQSRTVDGAVSTRPTHTGRGRATESLFTGIDRDRNGYLSDGELAGIGVRSGSGWVAMDRNGDGRIDRSEFQAVQGR
jgi:hypothetical protein